MTFKCVAWNLCKESEIIKMVTIERKKKQPSRNV